MTLDSELAEFKARALYLVHRRRCPGSRASLDDARDAVSVHGLDGGLANLEQTFAGRPTAFFEAWRRIFQQVRRVFGTE